jgi:GNAT superfamily N-acetyltransferase
MNIVQIKTREQLEQLATLGKCFYQEGKLPGGFNERMFTDNWVKFFSLNLGAIFALEEAGIYFGALGAFCIPDQNDGELVATEAFWWVAPKARGSGLRLLNRFEEWAEERQVKRLIMVHLSGLMPEKIGKLYERRGYHAVEVHYFKEL